MILDNQNENLKVIEWIQKYTEAGTLDIVTGYFTIGALAYLSKQVNDKITYYRLIFGDIVNTGELDERPLDLLNENITIEAALRLTTVAREAVRFLKQDKVLAKTLEPHFCHAKVYLFDPQNRDERNKYFISGSSNLTEAGVGLKVTHNVELNIAETGNNNQYNELTRWFEDLWNKKQAHSNKTLFDKEGNKTSVDFKEYLIREIERVFVEYTPRDMYYKMLFELFGEDIEETELDPDFTREVGRLESTVVYNTLYEFQKKGVISLIRMLQKYNGAILADAVGLGKTWSALAVMKYYQMKGREVVLLCPKKLEQNWLRYRAKQNSRFEPDKLRFEIRFHTDLSDERMNAQKYLNQREDTLFIDDSPKLFVIDESHNLRNDKSQRYQFLLEEILQKNADVKVLMLSATPINNSLMDIRNQVKLIAGGRNDRFRDELDIRNLEALFRTAQKEFNLWRSPESEDQRISAFVRKIDKKFFQLTDAITVARTRDMIKGQQSGLSFPKKEPPINKWVTPKVIGNYDSFEELYAHFPPKLSGYLPSLYVNDDDGQKKSVLQDEKQRDYYLVKMLYILLVKRLESSWYAFFHTVQSIQKHHQNVLDTVRAYQESRQNLDLSLEDQDFLGLDSDEFEEQLGEYAVGKKRPIPIREIEQAGNLDLFIQDLKQDIEALDQLVINLEKFEKKVIFEPHTSSPLKSIDTKLEVLIQEIKAKQQREVNGRNQKVVIFTAYRDTALYLFEQLNERGLKNLAMVSGADARVWNQEGETKKFDEILERFAPYTKLYREREWSFQPSKRSTKSDYDQWRLWIADNEPKTQKKLATPIDILIATDALSEGQNLQDADMVVNYDIHWNPVRIIQRMGRIDRLGSPNETIFGLNFWPSDNINDYLDLQARIEQRMAAMKLAGAEVDHNFSESFKEIAQDEDLENRMKARMLQQMESTWEDIEDNEEQFGFDDLSFERYRQDLLIEFNKDTEKYRRMPKGVYSGIETDEKLATDEGLIALLGYPSRPDKVVRHTYKYFDLIYIGMDGCSVRVNQKEIFDLLNALKDKKRKVPVEVDQGEEWAIQNYVSVLKTYLESQAVEETTDEEGNTKKQMGKEGRDILSKLKRGDRSALERIKSNTSIKDKYQLSNFDLICWLTVSN